MVNKKGRQGHKLSPQAQQAFKQHKQAAARTKGALSILAAMIDEQASCAVAERQRENEKETAENGAYGSSLSKLVAAKEHEKAIITAAAAKASLNARQDQYISCKQEEGQFRAQAVWAAERCKLLSEEGTTPVPVEEATPVPVEEATSRPAVLHSAANKQVRFLCDCDL